MMKNLVLVLPALAFCACSGPEAKKEEVQNEAKLVFSPQPGETHAMVYEMMVQNDSTGDRTNFMIDISAKVTSVDDKKIVLLTHYDAIRMTGRIHGKEVEMDAAEMPKEQSDASVVAAPVFAYLGKNFETIYDAHYNKVDEKQVREAGDSSVVAAESKVQFVGRYPAKAVKKGESWKSETGTKIGSNEIKALNYTVTSISENEVEMYLSGEINTSGEKFGREFSIQGDLKGNMTVDRKTGWQKKAMISTRFTLDMDGKKTPMQQTISFRLK